jgi:hypothetical protein
MPGGVPAVRGSEHENAMNEGPEVAIDWDCGSAALSLGRRLAGASARLRADVLADLRDQVEALLGEARAEADPEEPTRRRVSQQRENARRRQLCERLAGHTIQHAEPLVNGDVLLHLLGGRALVLWARHEDVKLDVVDDPMHARRHAANDGTGDFYLREAGP